MQPRPENPDDTDDPSTPVPSLGDRLGSLNDRRYEILDLLGDGGMGCVFRARDHELQRTVALKFLLPRQHLPKAEGLSLLRKEATAIARLDHENIVRIYDVA